MPRNKLSALKVELSDIHDIEMTPTPTHNFLVFRDAKGDIQFCVDADDVFDADGNRFENDL